MKSLGRIRILLLLSFILNSLLVVKIYYKGVKNSRKKWKIYNRHNGSSTMVSPVLYPIPNRLNKSQDIILLFEKTSGLMISPDNALHRWDQCLISIQEKIVESYSDILEGLQQEVILIDPAYHGNVGDNLISYGEMLLLEKMQLKYKECGIIQSLGLNEPCQNFDHFNRSFVGIWHLGGNWGDLWGIQTKRIASFGDLILRNMTVIGMPQSFYYNVTLDEITDAKMLNAVIETNCKRNNKIVLSWRQTDSYHKARELYPMVKHRLVPDIAFMVGPIHTPKLNRSENHGVDLLFLLRQDKESVLVYKNVTETIKTIINTNSFRQQIRRNVTFKAVDWDHCLVGPNQNKNVHVMHQLKQGNTSFDFNDRFTHAVSLISEGKVVITDRLHGSIFAFLCHKPHVYIDQMYRKIELTHKVAFDSSPHCQDKHMLMYNKAGDLNEAVNFP